MNLLIVDDNARVRVMIREVLADTANEIHECNDGITAIESYQKYHPDVVLMDIKMKTMNGLVAAQRIIQLDSKAKIIIVTNFDDNNLREAAKKAGALEYFLKEEIFKLPEYLKLVNQN